MKKRKGIEKIRDQTRIGSGEYLLIAIVCSFRSHAHLHRIRSLALSVLS